MLLLILGFGAANGQSSHPNNPSNPSNPSHPSNPSLHKNENAKISKWGFGANLGNIEFYTDGFQFGLAPNVAYRLADNLAVGAMVKLDYYYFKYRAYNLKFSSFDIGPTGFIRWKPLWETDGATPFLKGLFLQAEYERAFISREATDEFGNVIIVGNRIKAERHGEDYLYLGLGASSGYPFSTFFSIHYNIIDKANLTRIPFSYRVGFTYNY